MRVNLYYMPSAPKEYVVDFPRLDGGLNLWELNYRLDQNQSPDMINLWWQDGALCCRDGQEWVDSTDTRGTGYACYELLFWDRVFFHAGDKIYYCTMGGETQTAPTALITGVPQNRGTFFQYNSKLYYKNRGGYYEIKYDRDTDSFTGGAVKAFSPIIQINTEPTTGAGDTYQPENRICAQKTVWYSTVSGVKEYVLPVQDIDSVDKVVVDDVELEAGTGYTVDLEAGKVTFTDEPTHHDPVRANTVEITYTKANPDAMNSIMDCCYAAVFGGNQNVCVVLGGCPAQPNAYFWCGNHIVMDPGYFPMEQYNFAGDAEEAITGFGKQQAMLVIFKERSIGRASFGTSEMQSGRVLLTMDYTAINSRIGCDLPWTIQLIENNLVFCNKQQGVHIVKDSSSAYENNIVSLSRNVNGTGQRAGLLEAVRNAASVSSFDDDTRYWVVADGQAYVWDYQLSTYTQPSWFYFTGIGGIAFFRDEASNHYHMDSLGRLSRFARTFTDYGAAIPKRYRFATQSMNGFDKLKDVLSVLFSVRGDTDTRIQLTYETDYGIWKDPTPITSFSWRLAPRNLAYRYLGVRRFATIARRKPGSRHVRHFAMQLDNNEAGMDMSIVSAQIYYRYQGRER